jgi:hypothetical protein
MIVKEAALEKAAKAEASSNAAKKQPTTQAQMENLPGGEPMLVGEPLPAPLLPVQAEKQRGPLRLEGGAWKY